MVFANKALPVFGPFDGLALLLLSFLVSCFSLLGREACSSLSSTSLRSSLNNWSIFHSLAVFPHVISQMLSGSFSIIDGTTIAE